LLIGSLLAVAVGGVLLLIDGVLRLLR